MSKSDLDERLAVATRIAREAGDLALAAFQNRTGPVHKFKGQHDYLTETDSAVEKLLRDKIAARFPGDSFLGEESVGDDASQTFGRDIWVVDPIDGTANFARGVPHFCISLAIDSEKLLDLMRRVPIDPPAEPANAQRGIVVNTATPELLDAAIRLLRLLDRPADIAAMAPLIEQEILYRILTGPAGGQLMNIIAAGSHGNRIARAIAWLRENFARQLRIEDLADHIGMSVSSFHAHFKRVTAMSPRQYQKLLRLQEARRLLLTDALDAATAAFRVGYQSPSQFSRDYRRAFGAPPGADSRQSRRVALGLDAGVE